jgi:mannose-6-phosphate isomerase-like protein (cupin superfamily)
MSTLCSNKPCGCFSGKLWGSTQAVYLSQNVEVNVAKINKGGYCSWHSHAKKWNRFVVISGVLEVLIDKNGKYDIIKLREGMATDVPPKLIHQFRCLEDCICLEIYWIDDLDPNDIERHSNGGMNMDEVKQEEEATHIGGPLKGQQDFLVLKPNQADVVSTNAENLKVGNSSSWEE